MRVHCNRPVLRAAVAAVVTTAALVAPAQTTAPATTAPSFDPARPGYAVVPGVEMAAVQKYLDRGDTAAAARAMTDRLAVAPDDDQARFELGIVQFFQAVEHVSQAVYGFGIRSEYAQHSQLFGLPLQLRDNPSPRTVSYEDVRAALGTYADDLAKAEATLAGVKDPAVQVRLRPGTVRLDFVGDGKPTANEALCKLWPADFQPGVNAEAQAAAQPTHVAPHPRPPTTKASADEVARTFHIKFDRGDVFWLRGYCQLLMGMTDAALAYDEHDLFDRTAQLFFKHPKTAYPFLLGGRHVFDAGGIDVADAVAFVHLLHLPVRDAGKMRESLGHFRAMIDDSRQSWHAVMAETGDDHEWIPNPRQTPAFGSMDVDRKMVNAWLRLMDELDRVLAGKRLAPFWRGADDTLGVNVGKVFADPQPFDPILWAQGTGMAPFLDHGPHTDPKVYTDVNAAFAGDLLPFAAWFN